MAAVLHVGRENAVAGVVTATSAVSGSPTFKEAVGRCSLEQLKLGVVQAVAERIQRLRAIAPVCCERASTALRAPIATSSLAELGGRHPCL